MNARTQSQSPATGPAHPCRNAAPTPRRLRALAAAPLALGVLPAPAARAEDFYIDDGNVAALLAAINDANANDEPDTIYLAPNGHYLLEAVYDNGWGGSGLPWIESEITIEGNGATIERSSEPDTPDFRFFILYNFEADAELTLIDLNLTNAVSNTGGAIRNWGETLTLIGCSLINNTSTYIGGAIHTDNAGTVTIIDSTLAGNTAVRGGAINKHGWGGAVAITDSVISGNAATDSSAGGGLYIESGGSNTITRTVITGNSAASAASWAHGGGIRTNSASLTLIDCTLSDNHAAGGQGGAVYCDGTLNMSGTTVSGNSAPQGGGGIRTAGGLNMTNCTVSGNSTAHNGGGVVVGGPANITHSTIAHNTADNQGSGLILYQPLHISNSIVAHNDGGAGIHHLNNFNDLGFNIVQGGSGLSEPTSMNADPMLGPLADNGGGTRTHALLPASPAIDAGDCDAGAILYDQRGVERPQGAACDIGAFEAENAGCSPADLNADGQLNFFDISLFVALFQDQNPAADFNDDGLFNFFDFSEYIAVFNAGCP